MTNLLKNNSYPSPLLLKGETTEINCGGLLAKTKSRSFAKKPSSPDSGYTIIEAIVAMVVVAVLMIAIGPVLAFSVATRVQARRVELATQAARSYVDALKAGAIKGPDPGPVGQGFPTQSTAADLTDAPAPTGAPTNLYCIDLDGGGCSPTSNQDFYIQGYWKNQASGVTDPTVTGYELLVRVYRAASFDGRTLKTQKETGQQQSTVTSGVGSLNAPVVEVRTEIGATNTQNSSPYRSLCARLNSGSTKCQ